MVKPVYYGEYKSVLTTTTGCVHRFMTAPSDGILFPPMVEYNCPLCKRVHNFGLIRTWNVSTKRQTEGFVSYCAFNGIESDIEI